VIAELARGPAYAATTVLAVGLALLSSFLFALAAALQQREASTLRDDQAGSITMLLILVKRPLWLGGVAADAGGFVAVAAALGVGRLVVVQPLIVTVLLFALPLSARLTGRRVQRSDWAWAVVLTVALAVITVVGDATDGTDEAPTSEWLVAAAIAAVPFAVAMIVAGRRRGSIRALMLGIAAGLMFGFNDALISTVTKTLDNGIGAVLTAWPIWALVVVLVVGTWLQQASYQAGSLQASLPAVTGLEPVVGMILGLTLFDERFRAHGPFRLTLLLGAMVVASVAVVVLARAQGRADAAAAAMAPTPAPDPAPDPAPEKA
jgi:drug/metabolite transporter (DMT)-like permease